MVTRLNLGCKTAEDVFTLNTILKKFPRLKQSISHVEWTKFCEIDQMKKMNVSQFFFFQAIHSTQLTRKNNSIATF